jgi:uncharacterized membrane protein
VLGSPDMLLEASLQLLMSLADVLRFLHVVSAFLYVSGLIGRDVVLGGARRSEDLERVRTLLDASGPFDRRMVVPGSIGVVILGILTWWAEKIPLWGQGTRWLPVSLIVFATTLPLVPIVFLPRGRVFEAALASAIEGGRVTPELTAAFREPLVTAARWYEFAVVAFVLLLMVTKPF